MTTNYQRQQKGKTKVQGQLTRAPQGRRESYDRSKARKQGDEIDSKFGFDRFTQGDQRLGWLLNYLPITLPDESGIEKSALDLYFLDHQGGSFKATVFYLPYFFIDISEPRRILEVSQHLSKKFEGSVVEQVDKEDLGMANHLTGKKHKFIKISFNTVSELVEAKSQLRPIVVANAKREANQDYVDSTFNMNDETFKLSSDPMEFLIDMRENDVPYNMRVAIDLDLRVGSWYTVKPLAGSQAVSVDWQRDRLELCDLRILAFDIECEKAPLKFPDAGRDRIFMISYMISGQGYLLINRDIVTEDVADFEYTPLPKYQGPFIVYNEPDERSLLRKFVSHIQELRPHVIVTYNGDFFDWPYVETRCEQVAGISLYSELGIKSSSGVRNSRGGAADLGSGAEGDIGSGGPSQSVIMKSTAGMESEYTGRCIVHLDAFCWVKRDSYLPQGNQGLKAVTKYKLGYDPVEVDPEDMLRFARERPTHMASYSVSDAVATYYLYIVYVHNFIFSLSTIIPMGPEDVLRKGSGTLCEALLMVEAYKGNIICPNKQVDPLETFYNGHLLESETYIGGHVECLEAGVFRSDIPAKFKLIPSALQHLIDRIDRDLTFALETEHDIQRTDVSNYDEVRQMIVEKLEMLRDSPSREESPLIYHLDVGAMYPNIILTNRLQPSAMVSQKDCAACDFNRVENQCKRPMTWTWRGDYLPAGASEYQSIRRQLEYERIGDKSFTELPEKAQVALVKNRVKLYSQRVYRKVKQTDTIDRVDTVCMRENPFYVNTVRAFRDRRYDYKLLTKVWKGKKAEAEKIGDIIGRKAAEDKETLMDSLQLAHKCILNSFYGYVMRKGARWRSMEMAGIVTYTGAELIKQARELVEQVGRPLELDTDGIWCILPSSFPQDFKFKTRSGGSVTVGYPCAMLNADVHDRYTNHQYQDLAEGTGSKKYRTHSECSIYFELDGPYKAMVLPASPEEGKLLKKKYVVFNFDGTVAELKGFELKRRGELELVKIFQSQVFEQFLVGSSLKDCYEAVGSIANQWLDVLDSRGCDLDDQELLELISEKKTISKTLDDYEGRKATSLTTASRLADFLGQEMVKDKGLNCNLIISRLPIGAPVTDRAIPVAIFSAEPAVKRFYLRKWFKDPSFDCTDFRDCVDWSYYKERLGKTVQKIVTIPAGMQGVPNPCPRVEHPVWLQRSMNALSSGLRQTTITSMFAKANASAAPKLVVAPRMASSPDRERAGSAQGAQGVRLQGEEFLMSPAGKVRPHGSMTPATTLSPFRQTATPPVVVAASSRSLFGSPSGGGIDDIEDFGGVDGARGTGGRPVAHFRAASARSVQFSADFGLGSEGKARAVGDPGAVVNVNSVRAQITSDESVSIIVPTSDEIETADDFTRWLAARKDSWKMKRMQRKQEKLALYRGYRAGGPGRTGGSFDFDDHEDENAKKKPVGVVDFVRNAALSVSHGVWQIIELQQVDGPNGEFVVWAMTGKAQLQRMRITVPRVLYVNCNGTQAEAAAVQLGGVPVKKDLPHSQPCRSLFEVHVPEKKFQRGNKAFSLFLSDPQVEGVYEMKTPLWFRSVIHLGCVARVGSPKADLSALKLHDLESVHVQSYPYLHPRTANFRRIYLYCSVDRSRNSGFGCLGLFIVEGTNASEKQQQQDDNNKTLLSSRAHVWLSAGRGARVMPPLNRIYRRFQPDDGASVKFTPEMTSSVKEAYRLCSEALSQYLREKKGPTIVIAQCSGTVSAAVSATFVTTSDGGNTASGPSAFAGADSVHLRRAIPALQEFPLALIPPNSSDDLFPALGWQTFAAERMVQRYLIFPAWFNDRLACARYSQVPVCNLGADALTTVIDATFARHLQFNRHLLWASEGLLPDVGGAEAEGNGLEQSVWSDKLAEPVISHPGVYRCISVELDLYGIAACAIMSSGVLDAEGLTSLSASRPGAGVDGGASSSAQVMMDEAMLAGSGGVAAGTDASCGRAFNLLKAMVAKWFDDVDSRGEMISDSVLTALYRYLCGYGDALLRDPALHRIVYNLMSKLFKRLMGQLKRLGATVVYGDFTRVILHTNKRGIDAAREYIEYIIAALQSNEMFAYMEISVKHYWDQLLWMGPENFGGLRVTEGPETIDVDQAGEGDEDDEVEELEEDYTINGALKESNDDRNTRDDYADLDAAAEDDELDEQVRQHNEAEEKAFFDDLFGGAQEDQGADDEHDDSNNKNNLKSTSSTINQRTAAASFSQSHSGHYSATQPYTQLSQSQPHILASNPNLQAHWNIATFLPPAAAEYFHHIVAEFMLQYSKRRTKVIQAELRRRFGVSVGEEATGGLGLSSSSYLGSQAVEWVGGPGGGSGLHDPANESIDADDDVVREALLAEMKALVSRQLAARMCKLVDDLHVVYAAKIEAFPVCAGSHLRPVSAALEFVKTVTHVLSLDAELADEVSALKRVLLSQLKVREFSVDSKFMDPCLSYVLRDVICSYCSTCRDLDLLRDPALTNPETDKITRWRCSHCTHALDVAQVENRLLEEVGRLSTSFVLQDMRCPKTHLVSTRLLASTSDLCVPLAMDLPAEDIRHQLTVLLKVASFHEFQWLKETVQELLQLK